MSYSLMKSEPDEVSFDDVLTAPAQTVAWFGVRNYQARNFMRDQMQPGDGVLFYHSSCAEPGVAGIAEVASGAYPDESQFDTGGKYFDPKASRETLRWISIDVHAVEQGRYLPLSEMRTIAELEEWWRDNSTDSRSAACQVMPILNSAHACRGMAVRSFEG